MTQAQQHQMTIQGRDQDTYSFKVILDGIKGLLPHDCLPAKHEMTIEGTPVEAWEGWQASGCATWSEALSWGWYPEITVHAPVDGFQSRDELLQEIQSMLDEGEAFQLEDYDEFGAQKDAEAA